MGRQGVFDAAGVLQGYELLFRAAGLKGARVDLWGAEDQNLATEHVIAAAFHQGTDVSNGRDVSINFTGEYLIKRHDLQCDPTRVIIELVESATPVDLLLDRLRALRTRGFRIALDDFAATAHQCGFLPLVDFVKVDLRDIAQQGPSLVDRARGDGRVLVAERVETEAELNTAIDLGFDQFQGHLFEVAQVLTIPTKGRPGATR